jgi:hypothetical protein
MSLKASLDPVNDKQFYENAVLVATLSVFQRGVGM